MQKRIPLLLGQAKRGTVGSCPRKLCVPNVELNAVIYWYQLTVCKHIYLMQRAVNCMHVQLLGHVQLFTTLWTVDCQAPLSMGFFRQEYWSGLPFPTPEDLPNPVNGSKTGPLANLLPLSQQNCHLSELFLLIINGSANSKVTCYFSLKQPLVEDQLLSFLPSFQFDNKSDISGEKVQPLLCLGGREKWQEFHIIKFPQFERKQTLRHSTTYMPSWEVRHNKLFNFF